MVKAVAAVAAPVDLRKWRRVRRDFMAERRLLVTRHGIAQMALRREQLFQGFGECRLSRRGEKPVRLRRPRFSADSRTRDENEDEDEGGTPGQAAAAGEEGLKIGRAACR